MALRTPFQAPRLPYLALLQVGFAVPPNVATGAVRSYRTVSPLPVSAAFFRGSGNVGGLLSVALSVGSRPPGVTWHLIRRSPDFPPPPLYTATAVTRPTPRAHDTAESLKSKAQTAESLKSKAQTGG